MSAEALFWTAAAAVLSIAAWVVHNPGQAFLHLMVSMPLALLILYGIGVQGRRHILLRPLFVFLIPAWPLDLLLNYSAFVIWMRFDLPRWAEFTFSQRLHRLQYATGWAGAGARPLVRVINRLDPKHNHIPP